MNVPVPKGSLDRVIEIAKAFDGIDYARILDGRDQSPYKWGVDGPDLWSPIKWKFPWAPAPNHTCFNIETKETVAVWVLNDRKNTKIGVIVQDDGSHTWVCSDEFAKQLLAQGISE